MAQRSLHQNTKVTGQLSSRDMPMESMMRLILQVGDAAQSNTLSVPLKDRLLVGRGGGGEDEPLDLDFSAFDAASQGMSRNHAVLTYHDDALYIQDLNSTNGTRINGFTIPPERSYRLRNGDELEFGSFRVSVRVVRLPLASGGRTS